MCQETRDAGLQAARLPNRRAPYRFARPGSRSTVRSTMSPCPHLLRLLPQRKPPQRSTPGAPVTLDAAFAGVRRVPQAVNEPDQVLRARLARARGAQGAPRHDGRREDRHPAHHRRQGDPHRANREVRDAARSRARARRVPRRGTRTRRAGDRRGRGRPARVGQLAVGGSRRRLPARRRAARHDVARDAQRRDDARASRRRCSRRRSTRRAR